jgi:acyl-coenzyme A synthetase/AMP-(fatty) acid ligase
MSGSYCLIKEGDEFMKKSLVTFLPVGLITMTLLTLQTSGTTGIPKTVRMEKQMVSALLGLEFFSN